MHPGSLADNWDLKFNVFFSNVVWLAPGTPFRILWQHHWNTCRHGKTCMLKVWSISDWWTNELIDQNLDDSCSPHSSHKTCSETFMELEMMRWQSKEDLKQVIFMLFLFKAFNFQRSHKKCTEIQCFCWSIFVHPWTDSEKTDPPQQAAALQLLTATSPEAWVDVFVGPCGLAGLRPEDEMEESLKLSRIELRDEHFLPNKDW